MSRKNLFCGILLDMGNCEQQVLCGNVLILETIGLFEGPFKQLVRGLRKRCLCRPASNLGQPLNVLIHIIQHRLRPHADLLQHRRDNSLPILQQSGQ